MTKVKIKNAIRFITELCQKFTGCNMILKGKIENRIIGDLEDIKIKQNYVGSVIFELEFPLTKHNQEYFTNHILPTIGIKNKVSEIKIYDNEETKFESYDHFDSESTFIFLDTDLEWVKMLKDQSIIHSFDVIQNV
jgi:hypothetical protein